MVATTTRRLVSLTEAAEILADPTKTVRRYITEGTSTLSGSGAGRCAARSSRSSGSSRCGRWVGGGEWGEWVRRLTALEPQPPVASQTEAHSGRFDAASKWAE